MPILLDCDCGKTLKARDDLAGMWVDCPACGRGLLVPLPEKPTGAPIVTVEPEPQAQRPQATSQPRWRPPDYQAAKQAQTVRTPIAPVSPQTKSAEASWRGFVYWVLLLAMIPLAIETFAPHESDIDRLNRTLEKHPEVKQQLGSADEIAQRDEDEVLAILPGHRLEGALLSRGTWAHWLMALVSAGIFLGIVAYALPNCPARPLSLVWAGLFTGTAGVLLLTGIQIASLFGLCCILAAYVAALDPNAPFGASLIGFFFGVGFLEELIKAIPVLWLLYRYDGVTWRLACVIGMASGAGFGISEGIHYAAHYNGIESAGVYVVRFLSCVSFHTTLSGACAILLQSKEKYLHEGANFFDWIMTVMAIIAVPILLHGLFDTMVKKELSVLALLVAIAAFAWLAWLIKQAQAHEQAIATAPVASGSKFVRTAQGTVIRPSE